MLVYRISRTKYANSLQPSGIDGRWNSLGQKVIYTGGSASLSCLEVLVHKSGTNFLAGDFSISIIEVSDDEKVEEIVVPDLSKMHPAWTKVENYYLTQRIGNAWLAGIKSAVLKVPSAIIDLEYNYLLNPAHQGFSKVKIVSINKFTFDPRLKVTP